MENRTGGDILQKFTEITGIKTKWLPKRNHAKYGNIDGITNLIMGRDKIELPTEVKKNIVNPNIPNFINQLNANKKLLVLAETIAPKIKLDLKQLGINYIDGAGNAYVKQDHFLIYLQGLKPVNLQKDHKAKGFSKAGLKVIFQMLLQPELIDATIRDIAELANVSLDTVHKTIQGLKQAGHLIQVNKKTFQWNAKKELFQKWIEEYEIRLKPTIHIGNFRFLREGDFYDWKKLNFKNGRTRWGGEPGGELFTGFLKPETLTMYTNETKTELIKNYRIVPDNNGYIKAYAKFWKHDNVNDNLAPPLLVYADLINTGNKRNIETAQKIYEQLLQSKF